jgi:hypothetical protein
MTLANDMDASLGPHSFGSHKCLSVGHDKGVSYASAAREWLRARFSAEPYPSLSTTSKRHFVGRQPHDRAVLLVQRGDSSRFLTLPFHVHTRKARDGPELGAGNFAQRAKEGAGDDFEPRVQDIEDDGRQPECQSILGAVGREHDERSPVVDESTGKGWMPRGELQPLC